MDRLSQNITTTTVDGDPEETDRIPLLKVKLFIISRSEPRVKTGLVDSALVFVLHHVHFSLVDGDIRIVLKLELFELAQRRQLEGWPSDEHINLLCHRAARLFIYAAPTIKFLDNSIYLPERRWIRSLTFQKVQYMRERKKKL